MLSTSRLPIARASGQRVLDFLQQFLGILARAFVVLRQGQRAGFFQQRPRLRETSQFHKAFRLPQMRHHQVVLQFGRRRKAGQRIRVLSRVKKRLSQREPRQFVLRVRLRHFAKAPRPFIFLWITHGLPLPSRFLARPPSHCTLARPLCGVPILLLPVQTEVSVARPAPLRARRSDMIPLILCGLLCLMAAGAWVRHSQAAPLPHVPPVQPGAPVQPASPQPRVLEIPPLHPNDLAMLTPDPTGHVLLQHYQTTLDLPVQLAIQSALDNVHVPYAAVVILEPQTGRVLALVEHREAGDPVAAIGSLVQATVPAASVFKVVTAAALLEAGFGPELQACFHGGLHGLDASHVHETSRDTQCQSLTEALAHSTNAAFARYALRDLPTGALLKMAEQLGFNHPQPADLAMGASTMVDGVTDLERAKTAPGFVGSKLSPLHAAMLAGAIANDGVAMRPILVDRDLEHPDLTREPVSLGQWLPVEQARTLRRMMRETVVQGTGRHAFGVRPKSLRGLEIAGKTGSLNGDDPQVFRHISWFVGMAPVEKPQVAVAVLAINGMQWKAKAPTLARDALATWFAAHPAN